MLDLKFAPEAIRDLEKIYEYTLVSFGVIQAEKYQDEIFDAISNIATNPEIGSIYYFKKGNYRKLNVNRHIVFYRITDVQCLVIRILHDRIDLKSRL